MGQPVLYGAVAVLGGLVLGEALFLPWYSLDVTVAGAEVGSRHSAWHAMAAMDVLLLLAALAAVAGGVGVMRRKELSPIAFAAGVAGVLLSLVGLVDLPTAELAAVPGDTASVGREAGAFVALVASAGTAWAGYAAGTLRGDGRPRSRRTAAARAHPRPATRTAAPSAGRAAPPGAPGRSRPGRLPAPPPR
jgi:hypothetical protein